MLAMIITCAIKKMGKRIDEDVVDDPPAEHSKNDDEHDCKGDK